MANKYRFYLTKSLILLLLLLLVYFIFPQKCQMLDQKCFLFLNQNLLRYPFEQWFWGMLSHKNESWINVMVMLGINMLSIVLINHYSKHKFKFSKVNKFDEFDKSNECNDYNQSSTKAMGLVFYCWLSFQLVMLINMVIFGKFCRINRDSPSMIMPHPFKLSKLLNNPNIKDYSNNSFPAGHALVVIYWGLFINLYAPKLIKLICYIVTVLLILPRMITGAHWLSDIIFSLGLGWMYFNLSMWFAVSYEKIRNRLY